MLCEEITKEEMDKYPEYIKELKLDGTRCLYISGRLINRRGIDVTPNYKHIKIEGNVVLDGELVFFVDEFKTDFDLGRQKTNFSKVVFVVFDILKYNGENLMNKPLKERREFLAKIKGEGIRKITEFEGISWEDVEANNYEGLILKNPDSKYEFKRSEAWKKVKNTKFAQDVIKEIAMTENGSKVAILENRGVEQRVRVDGHNLCVGDKVTIEYLDITREGHLRQVRVI